MISYKMQADQLKTVKDYRDLLAESMFLYALNQRFFKISRRKNPPYFSCSAAADVLVRPLKAYIMTSSCKEKGTIEALESMLIEVCFLSCVENLLYLFIFLAPSLLLSLSLSPDQNVLPFNDNYYVSGCKGTPTWVFRTRDIYCPSFTDVRD
jgi:hypothetical protein